MSKELILKKLTKLEELIQSLSEPEEGDLFPPHWIILLKVKDEVNTTGTATKETLERMNRLWKINKQIEKSGGHAEYEKKKWGQIKEALDENDMASAVKYLMDSFIKDDGSDYELAEAKELIEERYGRKNKG